jgi:ribosome biogenesis GTPase / thiamine phosphate phosphatase
MTFDLSSLGWDEYFRSRYQRCERPDLEPARVTGVRPGVCFLLTAAGAARASVGGGLLAVGANDPDRLPVCGDWVVLRSWPDGRSTVEAVLPRRTALRGPTPCGPAPAELAPRRPAAFAAAATCLLAANVDTVAVVLPPRPVPDTLVDYLVALARDSGAASVVMGAADRVEPVPTGQTLALMGPPDTCRSTIVSALAGTTMLRNGQVLVPLPGGGCVLDTPDIPSQHARSFTIKSIDVRRSI